MRKFLQRVVVCLAVWALPFALKAQTYQVTNANFEDWSGTAFDGEAQPKGWNASNVEQVGMKFNFAHKEAGHNGGYCMMVQDQSVGAMGITETSPGYFSIGKPWAYLPSITAINQATAGTSGGQSWTHRPDTMSVWIKRTGSNWDKEDFYLLYYAWEKEAQGTSYKGKNTQCTSHSETNEESDIRITMNGNECKTTVKGEQVCEGMWRERATYGNWTNIKVPIYYLNDNAPKFMNMIFSASNYPNFRANDGLYEGNSLYVDDVHLIYSSKIQTLRVGGKEWKGFDPNSTDVQVYSVPEGTTTVPTIEAYRGAGSLTNARGTTKAFPGRKLQGSEITITNGTIGGTPTTIVVRAEDGSSTTTYRILFQAEKSSNAKLANIYYNYTDIQGVARRAAVSNFNPSTYNYKVELPYGAQGVPTIDVEKQEDEQTYVLTQPTASNNKATVVVTAANGTSKATYNLTFEVGLLADNTLQDILVNGKSIPGFTPSQAVYKVSLPTSTTTMPTVQAVSAYPAGEQTIVYTQPSVIDGGTYTISVTTPGNTVAKVYKLNFRLEASSYSYLADLKAGDYITNFNPENTTYYINMPLGTTSLPAITWTKGDEYQTVSMTDLPAGAVDGTVRVTVTAGNGDQTVYKLVFSTEKSEISILHGINIGGAALEGFDPNTTSYTYALPVGTTVLPEIEPIPADEFQTISITTAGLNGKTRITVTAGNGSTTIYQIAFSVATYTDNTLQGIFLDGVLIDGFDGETDEYWVNLPQGTTTLPVVTYTLQNNDLQTATVRPLSSGLNGDYKITVRPQSGASRTYIIHFSVATSSNTALTMIYLNGTPLTDFHPDTLHYTDSLPEGVSAIPAVTFDKAEASQRVLSVLENKTQTITVTAESGAKRVYTIEFIVRASENAYLEMIYLDGLPLPNFDSRKLDGYIVKLTGETCPLITVDKAPGQQVTIAAPYSEGEATIKVLPEQGSGNTYTILFEKNAIASTQLAGIAIDGVAIPDFRADSMSYTATYAKTLPVVTYTKKEVSQTVQLSWKGDVAWLHVTDELGNKAAYSISFTRIYSSDNSLQAILLDGTPMTDFVPTTMDYTRTLPAGSDYPEVGYVVSEEAQVIFFGQVETGKYAITVAAENGALATYTVTFTIETYTDVTLENLEVEGYTINYQENQTTYSGLVIDEGRALPNVIATPKEGQSVLIYTADADTQKVLVMAQNGAENTYTITYVRTQSNNAQLANILIDGTPLAGFQPEVHNYTYTLPHGARVVPNVNPVPQMDNQTVTTCFCRPNGVTTIHVEAQDGSTGDYTIAFPVEQSHRTTLGSLTIDGETKDVNTNEYNFAVPFGTVEPYLVEFEKGDEEQLIRFVDAPLTGETKIIVKAQTGEERTYTIRYTVAQPQGENKVKNIQYSYVTANDETVNGSLQPVVGDNIISLPFGAKSFAITDIEKNYTEQTIHSYDGGICRGAKIVAVSNRAGEADVVYTITPTMPDFDKTGKLETLKFKNALLPNWRPDVYNYMINVTAQPTAADFTYTAYDGKTVTASSVDAKKKQITFTVSGGETYSVCWYYTQYESIFDFSGDWVTASQGVGYKPSSLWKVPADCDDGYTWSISLIGLNLTYTTGKEVTPGGTNGVMLSTLRGAPMNGSVPGMMTLGTMSVSLTSSGNSTSSVGKGANVGTAYKNTPEALEFLVKPLSTSNITNWKMWLTISDGSNYKESNYTGDFNNLNKWATVTVPITLPTNAVSKFNVMLSSCDQENAKEFGGSTVYESSVMYDHIHFVYSSELTAVTVNGKATEKSGNTFTYTLDANEVIVGMPALKFTGKVPDQMQTIQWLNNGEWLNGELKAKVVNYGENSKDSTVYTVVLQRTPVTSLAYTANFGAYPSTTKGDTVFVNMPYGTKRLPDFTITPESTHQLFTMAKNGNEVKVSVTAEDGASATTVYIFRETKSNDVDFESALTASDSKGNNVPVNTVDAGTYTYSVNADKMPTIEYMKKIGQTVDLTYTADGATLLVTAADGVTTRTYTVNRLNPTVTTTGQIDEFEIGGNIWTALGGDTYTANGERPTQTILFTRKNETDSVVYIQAPDRMEWQVYGSANHTYQLLYPTTLSNNANLADILINGVPYSEFSALENEYVIESDSLLILTAVEAEAAQTIVTTQQKTAIGVEYTAVVAAQAGNQKTYTVNIRKPSNNSAYLAGIYLDGVLLTGFEPTVTDYTVSLPVPAVKKEQPKMPSVSYLVGHIGQRVELTAGTLNTDPTVLVVYSEDNTSTMVYTLNVQSAPSTCVDLTGITINDESVEQFEAGRHYYSHSLHTNTIAIDYTSDDRYQTVTTTIDTIKADHQYRYTLNVKAENGNEAKYEVMVYIENQSNDAQLANITLNGLNFDAFEGALNPDLSFDGGNNNYEINLPAGTTVLPEVSAQLKMNGQTVEIIQKKDSILLDVRAVDGTLNTYVLRFVVPLSKNADLSMIFLDGDSLPDFTPNYYFYQVNLPVGVHSMPEVAAQKGEAGQTIQSIDVDADKLQVTIKVQAEDPSTRENTYVVVFRLTQSDADQLNMIYQDGQPLDRFSPDTMYYSLSLPVGTVAFPDLSWQEQDDWQTIKMDTVDSSLNTLIRQIIVESESGKKSTYTVAYAIEKSAVDTLQMIFIDQKQLAGFDATTMEYNVMLTAAHATELNGAMPLVEYIVGDEYQTVMVSQMPEDSLSGKSLGYKSIITVTAATGKTRIYTIHYPVELSTEATLNMINLGGKPLANYDSERFNYKVEIEKEASIPVVSVIKKEEAQVYEIRVMGDTVQVVCWAESVKDSAVYTLAFERLKSSVTTLRDIVLTDEQGETFPSAEFPYRPEVYSYIVNLQYNADKPALEQLPEITPFYYDEEQTSETAVHNLPNGDVQVDITVTAPNGEDQAIYSITFHFVKPADALLASLAINGEDFADFRPTKTEYTYAHPFGTDAADYFTQESITYVLSDSLASAVVATDEDGVISITVTAQDGRTTNTYLIAQITALDNDNALAWITIDGDTLRGFDPDITFYTYYVMAGAATPSVDAGARSENADLPDVGRVVVGDTCTIICTAADGSERRYYIDFAISEIDPGIEATSGDVLIKRVPGTYQLMAATVRQGVTIALYDQYGHLVFYERVPVADPNDAQIVTGSDNLEHLNDVINTRSGLIIDIIPGQPYFYCFFADEKIKLSSGKIMNY